MSEVDVILECLTCSSDFLGEPYSKRTETNRESTEAVTGVMSPRAKEIQDQQPPSELGGGKEGCYPESQREQGPADTLISNLCTLEL